MALSTIFESCGAVSQREREKNNGIDKEKAIDLDLGSSVTITFLTCANDNRASTQKFLSEHTTQSPT